MSQGQYEAPLTVYQAIGAYRKMSEGGVKAVRALDFEEWHYWGKFRGVNVLQPGMVISTVWHTPQRMKWTPNQKQLQGEQHSVREPNVRISL